MIEQFGIARTFELGGTDLPDFEGNLILRLNNGFPVSWDLHAEWTHPDGEIATEIIDGFIPSFTDEENEGHFIEWRIPVTDLALLNPSQLLFSARMDSDGEVVFTGNEKLRLQVAIEGTHQVTVE